jgi:hypothetical protein
MSEIDSEIDDDELRTRARRAYERGRWRAGAVSAGPALALALICVVIGGQPGVTMLTGLALAGLIIVAVHRGGAVGRAVAPGLAAGALPLAAGLAACRIPHPCGGPGCIDFCAPLCLSAGVLAGVVLALHAHRTARHSSLAVGGLIALFTGALGCLFVGLGGVVGMGLGFLAGSTIGAVTRLSNKAS